MSFGTDGGREPLRRGYGLATLEISGRLPAPQAAARLAYARKTLTGSTPNPTPAL